MGGLNRGWEENAHGAIWIEHRRDHQRYGGIRPVAAGAAMAFKY